MAAATPSSMLLLSLLAAGWLPAQVAASPAQRSFLDANCAECHGGDSTKAKLDLTHEPADPVEALWRWSRLRERVHAGEMPPPDAEQPPVAARAAFLASVATTLQREVPKLTPDPGRVTVRRLSRTQWENVVRDLFGVRVSTAAFPADDLGYGFDSIGDALTFSTLHLEQYLAAAREVSIAVFDGEDPERPTVRRFEAEAMQLVDGPGAAMDGDIANLYTRATIEQRVRLPRDGTYRLRILAGADQAGDEAAKMALRFDGGDLETFVVDQRVARAFDRTTTLAGGEHRFELAFLNDFYDPKNPDPARRDRNLHIDWLEVTGPLEPRVVPPAQQWLHDALPERGTDSSRVRALVQQLLPAVWRRPATDAELGRMHRLGSEALKRGEPLATALRLVLQAALASPNFLFRVESGGIEGRAGDVVPLSGPALAARLSFFLWGSTPDARLLDLARKGRLGDAATLAGEVQRLLGDARAESLATDFAAQWLELRLLQDRTPDPARFPGFDDGLRQSLRRETELLFLAVCKEQRDVRELLSANFTYVDERLAQFYGIELPATADAVTAEGFRRLEWSGAQRDRGGVLGHASVLAVTSNPTRTSPVKRGRWILDNLLGQAPPPPPPGNDTLAGEAAIDSSRSFREQLAQHRERKACAVCHVRMDVLGFALERFDAIGRYREADAGGPIDSSGALPDGTRLDGLSDLKRVLAADPAFVRALAHKLFIYAIGRDLRPVDRLRVDLRVEQALARGKVTLPDLVLLVVEDAAFTARVVVPGG